MLPGGSSNVVANENFGYQTPVETILEKGLLSGGTVKKGSTIQISSPNALTPSRYALQTCFDGTHRHIIAAMDEHRGGLYAAFGVPAILFVVAKTILTIDKTAINPTILHCIQSDVEGMGMNLGFGLSRYDDNMMIQIVSEWPGYKKWFGWISDGISGESGKAFHDNRIPDHLTMERTNKYTYEKPGHEFHLICDGTSNLSFRARDKVDFEVIPNAIPYYVDEDYINKNRSSSSNVEKAAATNHRSYATS